MTIDHARATLERPPLRLWPGVVAIALQVLLWTVAPLVVGEGVLIAAGGSALFGLVVVLWWLFFSRAVWL